MSDREKEATAVAISSGTERGRGNVPASEKEGEKTVGDTGRKGGRTKIKRLVYHKTRKRDEDEGKVLKRDQEEGKGKQNRNVKRALCACTYVRVRVHTRVHTRGPACS